MGGELLMLHAVYAPAEKRAETENNGSQTAPSPSSFLSHFQPSAENTEPGSLSG